MNDAQPWRPAPPSHEIPMAPRPFVPALISPTDTTLIGGDRVQARTDLGWALDRLREGRAVTRAGWNGRGMWLRLQRPDAGSLMSLPYVYMRTAQGERVPWLCSQSDLLACDWQVVEDVSQCEVGKEPEPIGTRPPPLRTGPGGFPVAMQLFARGWDLRRSSWPPERWVQHPGNTPGFEQFAALEIDCSLGDKESPRDWSPTLADVHATDWVIADLLHCRHCGESLWRHDPALSGKDPQRVGPAKCGGARRLFAPKERTP